MPLKAKTECIEIPLEKIFKQGYWRPNPEKENPKSVAIPRARFSPAEKRQVLAFLKKVNTEKTPKANAKKEQCTCAVCHCGNVKDKPVPLALCREIIPTLVQTLEPKRGGVSLVKIIMALGYQLKIPNSQLYNFLGVYSDADVLTLNELFNLKPTPKRVKDGSVIIKTMLKATNLSKIEIHRVLYATAAEEGSNPKILVTKIKKALEKIE